MNKSYRVILTALFAWIACTFPAHAQSEHVAHYQAYNAALEQGDMASAIDQAEKAWRAAEENLGDNPTTAVLAYNYANLIYFSRPAHAVAPLDRVIAITGEDSDMFGVETPSLMLLLVHAYIDKDAREKEDTLRTTLDGLERQTPPPNLLAARAWLHLASHQMLRKRYERAEREADQSIRHYTPFIAPGETEIANAFILGGIARVAGRSRNTRDLREAVALFDQAIELFPPQSGIDNFDPQLAIALAWRSTTVSAAISDTPVRSANGSRIKPNTPELDVNAMVKWEGDDPDSPGCDMNWAQRPPPEYPDDAVREGYFGAVLIGYNIVDGKVDGARILAEVPAASVFGETSRASMDNWQLAEEPPVHCQRNRLVEFQFAFGG